MKIQDLHESGKPVSAIKFFDGGSGPTMALQILAGEELKAHVSKVPALLLCITGDVTYHADGGQPIELTSGMYVHIEPMVSHRVKGNADSQLILLK
jgi:quercetin dioxygenase-like cupin family protein